MQKPTQLGDFNDLVLSTINVLEDRVAALENRIKALETNKPLKPEVLEGQKTVAFKG